MEIQGSREQYSLHRTLKKTPIKTITLNIRCVIKCYTYVNIAIYISAEIKLQDEKNMRQDIYFMKEFKTFLVFFCPKRKRGTKRDTL